MNNSILIIFILLQNTSFIKAVISMHTSGVLNSNMKAMPLDLADGVLDEQFFGRKMEIDWSKMGILTTEDTVVVHLNKLIDFFIESNAVNDDHIFRLTKDCKKLIFVLNEKTQNRLAQLAASKKQKMAKLLWKENSLDNILCFDNNLLLAANKSVFILHKSFFSSVAKALLPYNVPIQNLSEDLTIIIYEIAYIFTQNKALDKQTVQACFNLDFLSFELKQKLKLLLKKINNHCLEQAMRGFVQESSQIKIPRELKEKLFHILNKIKWAIK